MRARLWLVVLFGLIVAPDCVTAVVTLRAQSASVDAPGDTADLCVALDSGGAPVAGTQNDLVWDGSCATLPSASACRISPGTGKQLHGGFPPQFDFTYRALVLSLDDLDPVPDGELYCCGFIVEADPGSCCRVSVVRAGASDPRGSELAATGNSAQLCVRGVGPPGSPTPTGTPDPRGESSDGCQTAPPGLSGVAPVSVLAAVSLAVLLRALSSSIARRALRRRRRER